jgi:hypothetical protein
LLLDSELLNKNVYKLVYTLLAYLRTLCRNLTHTYFLTLRSL